MLIWKIALQTIFLYIGSQALEQLEGSVFSTSQQSRTKVLVFFKLHFIDYAITVVLIVPTLPASTQHPPLPQAVLPPLFMSMGHECKFFGCSISCTVLYIPWLFCNYLFVLLNPLTSSPILPHSSPIWRPSGN